MRSSTAAPLVLAAATGLLFGCSTAPPSQEIRNELLERAKAAMTKWARWTRP
jgi:hypothetical protein